jgi:Holliday junction resolvasome RuvABC endonuclease subunit
MWINQKYPASYKDIVQHVHESIQHHHPELWATGKWFLLYNSVICQRIFVSSSNCCTATHIIFSRFVTLHFFLLPQLKWAMKGTRYADIQAIQIAMTKHHSRKSFPGLLQRPPETLEAVY